ncbi:MAG TPA: hypothetical protein PLU72_17850 [Candidatus Ozemobacteraceae bacterium]|nr:hypothetical protein [Candidatus Ozemobacteraceae bacterium]HQG27387.1 hypothetical protein [Candidatus Ozemobacteraceae bacterium]
MNYALLNRILYFVSFAYAKSNLRPWEYPASDYTPERGFSCTSLMRKKPVTSFDDIVEMAREISRENKLSDVVIISWQRFESNEQEEKS